MGCVTCCQRSDFSVAAPFISVSSLRASLSCWILATLSWTFSAFPFPSVDMRKTHNIGHIPTWKNWKISHITSDVFFHFLFQLILQVFHCVCNLSDATWGPTALPNQSTVLVMLGTHVICYNFAEHLVSNLGGNLCFVLYLLWLFPPLLPWLIFNNLQDRPQNVFQLWTPLVPTQDGERALFNINKAPLTNYLQVLGQLCQPVGVVNFIVLLWHHLLS